MWIIFSLKLPYFYVAADLNEQFYFGKVIQDPKIVQVEHWLMLKPTWFRQS